MPCFRSSKIPSHERGQDTVGRSNTVAMDFGRAVFGPVGGTIFAFMVAFSCFGALNGIFPLCSSTFSHMLKLFFITGAFFTTSRLICAAGREGYLPSFFGRLHSTRKTPFNATLLQAAITSAFILMGGGFRSLISFSVVAGCGFYFLSVSLGTGCRERNAVDISPFRSLGS